MNEQERKERIEWLEKQRFYLSMKDRWTAEDYATDGKWFNELRKLKEEG